MGAGVSRQIDWAALGDLVLAILESIGSQPEVYEEAARRQGITIAEFIAAAIMGAIQERVEGDQQRGTG